SASKFSRLRRGHPRRPASRHPPRAVPAAERGNRAVPRKTSPTTDTRFGTPRRAVTSPTSAGPGPMRHDGSVTSTPRRPRMTGQQRREQLLTIGRTLFAEKGFDGTSVEEIAARAEVSKPVVYEHVEGKEALYAVIVDREVATLLTAQTTARTTRRHPRITVEGAALALLLYIEENTDGFRILVRDSPVAQATG